MTKHHRLSSSQDFKILFRKGKRIETRLLRITTLANNLSYARIALIVPRAIEKRAVLRNRLRRRVSEWIRRNIAPGLALDIAILFKKESISSPRKKIYEELSKTLGRYNN